MHPPGIGLVLFRDFCSVSVLVRTCQNSYPLARAVEIGGSGCILWMPWNVDCIRSSYRNRSISRDSSAREPTNAQERTRGSPGVPPILLRNLLQVRMRGKYRKKGARCL
jgi:hypothetical protein